MDCPPPRCSLLGASRPCVDSHAVINEAEFLSSQSLAEAKVYDDCDDGNDHVGHDDEEGTGDIESGSDDNVNTGWRWQR